MSSCYDHPSLYHLSYSHDLAVEIRFIKELLARFLGPPPTRILEPACGTGRVLVPLLEAGYRCTGFDNNPKAISYLNRRLRRKNLRARILNADLVHFSLGDIRYDGALCTVDTFRHLLNERDALNHLCCVARHLRKNGIYLLALDLLPQGGYTQQVYRCRDRKGSLDLHTTISVLDVNRKRREETISIVFNTRTPRTRQKYRYMYKLRTYTMRQLTGLLKKIPSLEVIAAFDYYSFDAESPIQPDARTEDVLLVLRKRR